MRMIDHFEIKVKDLQISEGFYRSFLAPLDYKLAFKTSSLISFLSPNSPHPGGDFFFFFPFLYLVFASPFSKTWVEEELAWLRSKLGAHLNVSDPPRE
ncbi:hypothetical protein GO775_14240 [Staphylococcus aureus]|nr:hypothetical protein [Staphylococcus aureus]